MLAFAVSLCIANCHMKAIENVLFGAVRYLVPLSSNLDPGDLGRTKNLSPT